jgi:aminomethyltransferase
MSLSSLWQAHGATLAQDGIPLHYGNTADEVRHVEQGALLLDRSHEGRIVVTGESRLSIVNRISTNALSALTDGRGTPTLLTNANARIIDRLEAYPYGEGVLYVTGAGRGQSIQEYLQRNIFFNDHANLANLAGDTCHLALHGASASAIVAQFLPLAVGLPVYACAPLTFAGATVFAFQRKALYGTHWAFIVPNAQAEAFATHLLAQAGVKAGGSLAYNALRVRAGIPANAELSLDYLPLELGLWDEVSFSKGCYTGQEIIARMDSREKLARVMVALHPAQAVAPNTPLLSGDGQNVGTLTSSMAVEGLGVFAMGVLKLAHATMGNVLRTPEGVEVGVGAWLGAYPDWIKTT